MNLINSWVVTPTSGSALISHAYSYTYDGNGNRTQIYLGASNYTNLSYNADNEWYQSTDQNNNVNLVNWDAAGNLLGNNGFGGMSPPLTVTYNAKEQTATQTDINQYPSPMTFTGRGQGKQVSETTSVPNGINNPTTTNFVYSLLGLTQTDGAPIPYVRDPSGNLVSQQGVSGGPYYYLSDGQGSVAGMADASGGQAAGYFYCPTGNAADAAWGSAASGNPFQYQSGYYDAAFKSYWLNGQQFDSGSGNAFSLTMGPDDAQQTLLDQARSLAISLGADAFGLDLATNVGVGIAGQAGVDILYNLRTNMSAEFAMFGAGFGIGGEVAGAGLVVFNLPNNSDFAGPFVNISGGLPLGVAGTAFTSFPGTGDVAGFAFGPGGGTGEVSGTLTTDVLISEQYWGGASG